MHRSRARIYLYIASQYWPARPGLLSSVLGARKAPDAQRLAVLRCTGWRGRRSSSALGLRSLPVPRQRICRDARRLPVSPQPSPASPSRVRTDAARSGAPGGGGPGGARAGGSRARERQPGGGAARVPGGHGVLQRHGERGDHQD